MLAAAQGGTGLHKTRPAHRSVALHKKEIRPPLADYLAYVINIQLEVAEIGLRQFGS
jgi:hypothetical protein